MVYSRAGKVEGEPASFNMPENEEMLRDECEHVKRSESAHRFIELVGVIVVVFRHL